MHRKHGCRSRSIPLGRHPERIAANRRGAHDAATRTFETLPLLDTGAPQATRTLRAARRAGIEEADLTPAGRAGGAGEALRSHGQVASPSSSWVGNRSATAACESTTPRMRTRAC